MRKVVSYSASSGTPAASRTTRIGCTRLATPPVRPQSRRPLHKSLSKAASRARRWGTGTLVSLITQCRVRCATMRFRGDCWTTTDARRRTLAPRALMASSCTLRMDTSSTNSSTMVSTCAAQQRVGTVGASRSAAVCSLKPSMFFRLFGRQAEVDAREEREGREEQSVARACSRNAERS